MEFEENSIIYPPVHPGTDRTFLRFYSGRPNLNDLFYSLREESSPQRIFVTDTNVASLPFLCDFISFFRGENFSMPKIEPGFIGKRGNDTLIILGSGEKFKTIESVLDVCGAAVNANAQRSTVFVGIGGGVITDMTAFASSIFKRGSCLELVPTTLLSMVDAAIGGKTGCDFNTYKNMIGSFFPAQKIHIFPEFLLTLPQSEYRSGMAEAVKTAMLYSKELFYKMAENPNLLNDRTSSLIHEVIKTCVKAKARVVEQDLTEKNIRMQLNLGHTFAHALESRAGLGTVSHGDAVAWGIGRAAELSRLKGICSSEYVSSVKKILADFGWETEAVHSAMKNKNLSDSQIAQSLYQAMKKDKKNSSSKVKFVLQEDIGETVITEIEEKDILEVLTGSN